MVNYLYDSNGIHIANMKGNQLYLPTGKNIGHYLTREKIFIDMKGYYLGELYNGNRLLYKRYNNYININYGIYGNYGNIGNYGNPGRIGSISLPYNFIDVKFKY